MRTLLAGFWLALWPVLPAVSQEPRLDRVSLWGTRFEEGGTLNTWIYVQGANADADAEVFLDDEMHPTAPHRLLRSNLYGVSPAALGYPITHYRAFLVASGKRVSGSTVRVRIRNRDGQLSAERLLIFPKGVEDLDSDGDDIPDEWEIRGYDADGDGTLEVNLPALGAHPLRPDILLELDVMEELQHRPRPAVLQLVRDAFAAAPILNPVGPNGINLIVDATGTLPFARLVQMDSVGEILQPGATSFYALKTQYFDEASRGRLYHYCIWGNMTLRNASGVSDANLPKGIPGDDCLVSFDDFPEHYHTVGSGSATLMHELGHNLLQRHGGSADSPYLPPYNSVMSYSWQLRGAMQVHQRAQYPICTPFYYGRANAMEKDGRPPSGVGTVLDYSEGMNRSLNEASLDETEGVCGLPVDWNGDKKLDPGVARDLDRRDGPTGRINDYANWPNLDFSGPRRNGRRE